MNIHIGHLKRDFRRVGAPRRMANGTDDTPQGRIGKAGDLVAEAFEKTSIVPTCLTENTIRLLGDTAQRLIDKGMRKREIMPELEWIIKQEARNNPRNTSINDK